MSSYIETFNDFLKTKLNNQQYLAVTQTQGPSLVIAGAGSGKTRIITTRIAYLIIQKQVLPESIIALTFTNKAAQEMKERITQFFHFKDNLPFIGTFHAYCLSILKKNKDLLPLSFSSLLDSDDQQKLLHTILCTQKAQKIFSAKQLAHHISHLKNNGSTHTEIYKNNRLLYALYTLYEQEKKTSQCIDFDDLLVYAVELYKHVHFQATMQKTVRHILVDEYQDTNITQHTLLRLMALNAKSHFAIDSLCAVGDEDQSIYSWRGATIANIINFKKDFPQTQLITIEQNYRSAQPILDVANNIIKNNNQRNKKQLWSTKQGFDCIRGFSCASEYQEAHLITHFIQAIKKISSPLTITILYRTHFQSRVIEESFIKNSIPYTIVGGIQFYERKEIKDILAYFRLIANPFDRISFSRIVNCPLRGFGPKFEQLYYQVWNQEPFLHFRQINHLLCNNTMLSPAKREALLEFDAIFNDLSATTIPSIIFREILTRTKYIAYLQETYDPHDAQARCENINELFHAITHLENNGIVTLAHLLEEIALMHIQNDVSNKTETPVTLMTLHSAKGLEFDIVIIAGIEDGIMPSARSVNDPHAFEEERRLFYVGITRAKEYVLLTYTHNRYLYGIMKTQAPSPFIKEIPSSLISWYDSTYWTLPEISNHFDQWLHQTFNPTCNTNAMAQITNNTLEGQDWMESF